MLALVRIVMSLTKIKLVAFALLFASGCAGASVGQPGSSSSMPYTAGGPQIGFRDDSRREPGFKVKALDTTRRVSSASGSRSGTGFGSSSRGAN
jgi:hypothetical protein